MLFAEDIDQLISYPCEIDILDFKEKLYDFSRKHELAEFVKDAISIANSAFANVELEGSIVFGIKDKGRIPVGIQSQVISLKNIDVERQKNKNQDEINANNQRRFREIINKYIEGKGGNLRFQYITHTYQGQLIGVICFKSLSGPFSVKNPIERIGSDGKTVGEEVSCGESWIRDGEDKRKLTPKEYTDLSDKSRSQKKLLKLLESRQLEIGNLMFEWRIKPLHIDEGVSTKEALVPRYLQYVSDFRDLFIPWPNVETFFSKASKQKEPWYLNHIIIKGPNGSGRSSLLHYLAYKRQLMGRVVTPFLLEQIPDKTNFNNFIKVLYFGQAEDLDIEDKKSPRGTLLIDIHDIKDSFYPFLSEITTKLKNWYIWITCSPNQDNSIKQALASEYEKSGKDIYVLETDFLDSDETFFQQVLNKVFDNSPVSYQVGRRKNVLFSDLVTAYLYNKNGFDPHELLTQLSREELLFLKLISAFQPISHIEANFIKALLRLQPDVLGKLISNNLIYITSSADEQPSFIGLTNEVDRGHLRLSDLDIIYFSGLIDNFVQLNDLGIEATFFSYQLSKLNSLIADQTICQKIYLQSRALRGNIYCENCLEYFDDKFEHCPNCGIKVNRKKKRVEYTPVVERAMVPFPNAERIRAGTFKSRTIIEDKAIKQLLDRINSISFNV